MKNEYYSSVTMTNGDTICHYGKKGMKWGRHKTKMMYAVGGSHGNDYRTSAQTTDERNAKKDETFKRTAHRVIKDIAIGTTNLGGSYLGPMMRYGIEYADKLYKQAGYKKRIRRARANVRGHAK